MSDNKDRIIESPPYLHGRIPSPDRLIDCFVNEPPNVDGDTQLYRVAYVSESVLPDRAQPVYRFGRPPDLIGANGGWQPPTPGRLACARPASLALWCCSGSA
jgi:hypothetical protein